MLNHILRSSPQEIEFKFVVFDTSPGHLYARMQRVARRASISPLQVTTYLDPGSGDVDRDLADKWRKAREGCDLALLHLPRDSVSRGLEFLSWLHEERGAARIIAFLSADQIGLSHEVLRRGADWVALETFSGSILARLLAESLHPGNHTLLDLHTPEVTCLGALSSSPEEEGLIKRTFSPEEESLIKRTFPGVKWVTLHPVGSGLGGGQKYRAQTEKGQEFFLKLAPTEILLAERQNFFSLVEGIRDHYAARMIEGPVITGKSGCARYSVVGGRRGPSKTLKDVLLQPVRPPLRAARQIIDTVCEEGLQDQACNTSELWPHLYYEILPPLLQCQFERFHRKSIPWELGRRFVVPPSDEQGEGSFTLTTLRSNIERLEYALEQGDELRLGLSDFVIQEANPDKDLLQLIRSRWPVKVNLKVPTGVRELLHAPKVKRGKVVSVNAILTNTLRRQVREWKRELFPHALEMLQGYDPPEEFLYDLLFCDSQSLEHAPTWVQQVIGTLQHVPFGFIHGDLNLDNIVIEVEGRSLRPWLVDFEKSRRFSRAFDLVKLEVEASTHLVASEAMQIEEMVACEEALWRGQKRHPRQAGERVRSFYTLLAHIRNKAVAAGGRSSVYLGLMLYALSALKFSLPAQARQFAYVKSAVAFAALLDASLQDASTGTTGF